MSGDGRAEYAAEPLAYHKGLMAALQIRPDGRRGDPKDVVADLGRWLAALHEAAHAVVAAAVGAQLREVTIDPERGDGGRVRDPGRTTTTEASATALADPAAVGLVAETDTAALARIGVPPAEQRGYTDRAARILAERRGAW